MHSPPPHGHGYGYGGPPPPRSSSNNVLVIVLVIVVVLLVLGGGSCLLCVGLAAVADDPASGPATSSTSGSANGLERTPLAVQLEGAMKGTKVPVQQVLCPKEPPQGTFKCELVTTSGDRADVDVTPGPTGLAYDVPGMAFLEGTKLESTFRGIVASINPRLRVPCFTGVLMKKVGGPRWGHAGRQRHGFGARQERRGEDDVRGYAHGSSRQDGDTVAHGRLRVPARTGARWGRTRRVCLRRYDHRHRVRRSGQLHGRGRDRQGLSVHLQLNLATREPSSRARTVCIHAQPLRELAPVRRTSTRANAHLCAWLRPATRARHVLPQWHD